MFFGLDSPFVEYCFIEEADRSDNRFRARVRLKQELTNSMGGAHGGLIATILDASMTVAARYAADPEGREAVSTVDLSVSYIGQARSVIDCEGRLTARQKRTLFMEGWAWNEDGDLIARATSTMRILSSAARE